MRSRIIAALAAAIALVALAAPAYAHVTIQPGEAVQGDFFKITFRTPNERDDAGTTKLEVQFPEEYPFAFLNVRPVAGWTVTPERKTLDEPFEVFGTEYTEAVTKITWEGGTINPGEFQEFEVSVGPLPSDTDLLMFPALQTYSSGEVVRWVDEDEEGERPAPRLHLVPADGEDEEATDSAADAEQASGLLATAADVDDAETVGYVGIGLGALGIVAAAAALLRARRRPGSA